MHEDLGYISQNPLTKDAGKRNQALRLDVCDCAHSTLLLFCFEFRRIETERNICENVMVEGISAILVYFTVTNFPV